MIICILGFDLFTPVTFQIKPLHIYTLDMQLSIQLPPGFHGVILPKSGLFAHYRISCHQGLIDTLYTASLKVVLKNESRRPFTFHKGQKVAQLVIHKTYPFIFSESHDPFDQTRGGFGSTGLFKQK